MQKNLIFRSLALVGGALLSTALMSKPPLKMIYTAVVWLNTICKSVNYWTDKSKESMRDNFLYYHESILRAVRINQWKLHFETIENYYDPYQKQKFPVMYNLRQDPFETFDSIRDRSDIIQTKQWISEPLQALLGLHIKSLMDYPPVQKAATLDFSELIKNMQTQKQ